MRFSEWISVQREKYVPGVVFKIYNGHIQRKIAPLSTLWVLNGAQNPLFNKNLVKNGI